MCTRERGGATRDGGGASSAACCGFVLTLGKCEARGHNGVAHTQTTNQQVRRGRGRWRGNSRLCLAKQPAAQERSTGVAAHSVCELTLLQAADGRLERNSRDDLMQQRVILFETGRGGWGTYERQKHAELLH